MQEERDVNSPQYKALRFHTFKRDGFCCVLCQSKVDIECHHIRRWADWEVGRFLVSNCVTLCKMHHEAVTGREDLYKDQFQKIVALKKIESGSKNGNSSYQSNQNLYKRKWKPENPYRRY